MFYNDGLSKWTADLKKPQTAAENLKTLWEACMSSRALLNSEITSMMIMTVHSPVTVLLV